MNFEPTDYLQNLNLEFDSQFVSPNINQQQLDHDLDLFSSANHFFSLDVLGNDNIVPVKSEVTDPVLLPHQPQQQQTQQQQQQQPISSQQPDYSFLNFDINTQARISSDVDHEFKKPQKRSISEVNTPMSTFSDESATGAASEDKRKRNTAASARFRIKKKLKEQEMEKRSKELEEKVVMLEKKLKQLEMENKCLKNMILQQNEQKNEDLLKSIKERSILDSKSIFQYTK
ncbi:uncharacterized protein SPAPADRAFT_63709 [Spathaspora passalidarum NRRL Y-27907]|uniref:BZIP domain-containing protein n=1 Tax=Spathaspora passalidarum (strain NRRL Y-27907 / 11-Y1) TaxID=619300 RepID=G3AV10_SPAPN|nr:uncharacterized protein SPAPADRAFT_63709 [Spathaspora passalidarum NRRL Y-27907]EGW30084.1 hypothetical protein SPAPADRAFT_63709 [Spathaspora passalidarum NRRL Y-27907]